MTKVEIEKAYNEKRDYTLRFALKLTGNREDAEDLVQAAALRVLSSAIPFRGESSETTHLVTIMRNLRTDQLRQVQAQPKRRTVPLEPWTYDLGDRRSVPQLSLMAGQEDRDSILRTVLSLPPRNRRVVLSIYFAGQSYREASLSLRLSLGAIRGIVHRSLVLLRGAVRAG